MAELESPAEKVVRLLGAKAIAAKCNLTTDAVWKWKTQGRGLVPARYQAAVLDLAAVRGVSLTAADVVGVA